MKMQPTAASTLPPVQESAVRRQVPSKLAWLTKPFAPPAEPLAPSSRQPFIAVSSTLVRGRRPRLADLDRLKQQFGIKTIINMEDTFSTLLWPWDVKRLSPRQVERAAAQRGMTAHWIPVSCISEPRMHVIQRILDIMDDPAQQPVYLHCFKGFERTNFVLAMHRIFRQHHNVHEAYCDMLAMGFRRPLVPKLHGVFFAWTRAAAQSGVRVGRMGREGSRTHAGAAAALVGAQLMQSLPKDAPLTFDEIALPNESSSAA